ncbi:flagellar assembly peptidoglycan hydrolase FlgJ [Legionella hackeliae]|uniref:Peptidoglycan hydrolase FlgJ n=1 Tax=Legionella hackeliae TaxID=449 RepID=A0A0A8UU57_LEGHA|nr:flagellar assembly peptidoglycan hydrolase FlgJ [Legionella hackeliae]KTD09627.1 muramidase, peptidoglycan hydrolase FlgJ [Legionella hackeliae]CEK11056.1 Flagellar biosynthesis protein FlgJ [Legionella hackeliae]STX47803.1 muramidase, peptidoglycan hydrolase FlgJ [Legionella hackeliae]
MATDGIAVGDFKNLHNLKLQAQKDGQKALPEVSKQFEAIFLQSMLKSMRMGGQYFLDDSSPFKSNTASTFQDMLDGQYATNISQGKGVGLASVLAKQLAQTAHLNPVDNTHPVKPMDQSRLSARIPSQEMHSARETNPKTAATIDEFVKSIWPYARQAANLLGLDPKLLMAQAALETGWGQYVTKGADGSTSNNLFNIKATSRAEDSVKIKTTEYIADTPIKVNASFRRYPSIEHSFNDYVALIQGSGRYEAALANANDPERYVGELHRAGYATDPDYASKIMSIYHGDELQQALARNGFSME